MWNYVNAYFGRTTSPSDRTGAIEAIQWLETSPAANPDGVSDKELLGTLEHP